MKGTGIPGIVSWYLASYHYAMAAYDQPQGQARPPQARNWQGPPNRQFEQLQRQINRLENELRRYQNPHRPDFRSFGRSFRSAEETHF